MSAAETALAAHPPDPWWRRPWVWMVLALVSTGLAFAWARLATAEQPPPDFLQVPLVVGGVLAAGTAVWRRCASPQPTAYLDALSGPLRQRALTALALIHGLLALAVSALLVARLGGARQLPGDMGGTIFLWLLAAPWGAWSAWQLLQRAQHAQPLPVRLETAVLTTQAGVAALLGSWALYWGPDLALEWDSFRLFLGVAGAVAFLAAPIAAAEAPIRRLAVSILILVHFAAIATAVIGSPPGPYIIQEAQHWIFRPYLDFMYLNNAYRFYSPEPSPASQVWFRVEYDWVDNGKPLIVSHWMRLPEMGDDGSPRYLASVQYTRRVALTENVARSEAQFMVPDGKNMAFGFIKRRMAHVPVPEAEQRLGQMKPKEPFIPLHPFVQNFQQPTAAGRQLLESFARHVLSLPPPKEYPGAKPKSVKIYRVWHLTCTAQDLNKGLDPHDWTYYIPYYVGQFDPQGNLLDPEDPFLYWALPILRDYRTGEIRCYLFKHSGDDNRFRNPTWKQ